MSSQLAQSHAYVLTAQDTRWVRWVAFSLLAHMGVFLFAWWLSNREPSAPRPREHAILVQPIAWAPEERPKHWLPRMEATPPPPKVEPEQVKIAANPVDKPETEDEKKKREKEEKDREQKERQQREARMQEALRRIKNDYKSWDGSPDGVQGGLSNQALAILGNAYAAKLREAFRANFAVPETIPNEEVDKLRAKILVKIDQSGRIREHKLTEGSGNAIFDSAALRAVQRTPTVPLPDDELKGIVFRDGILINFSWKL